MTQLQTVTHSLDNAHRGNRPDEPTWPGPGPGPGPGLAWVRTQFDFLLCVLWEFLALVISSLKRRPRRNGFCIKGPEIAYQKSRKASMANKG